MSKKTKRAETDKQKTIAAEIGFLSVKLFPQEKYRTGIDVHDRVWRAFELGREYQREESK